MMNNLIPYNLFEMAKPHLYSYQINECVKILTYLHKNKKKLLDALKKSENDYYITGQGDTVIDNNEMPLVFIDDNVIFSNNFMNKIPSLINKCERSIEYSIEYRNEKNFKLFNTIVVDISGDFELFTLSFDFYFDFFKIDVYYRGHSRDREFDYDFKHDGIYYYEKYNEKHVLVDIICVLENIPLNPDFEE
jgi:hypothetical protein